MKARDTHGTPRWQAIGKTRWERMERNAFTLDKLAEVHAAAYLAENKSRRTVEWHTVAIHRFGCWVQDTLGVEPTLKELTLENVRTYSLHLRTQPRYAGHPTNEQPDQRLSDESVSFYLRGLRAFASWLEREGYTAQNVLVKLKTPKVPDREVDILTQEEVARVMHLFNPHTEIGVRDLAIFALLLDTGMRASELCDLRLRNLHLDQGYAIVYGKGKKERPVKVGARTAKALRLYLAHWRKPARASIDQVILTVGHKIRGDFDIWGGAGEPLTVNALQRIMRHIGRQADIPRLHPHLLRHTFACMYLMEHHDPFALKNLLGHTTLTMTYRYVRAVERLMVVKGGQSSVLDSLVLPPPPTKAKRKQG
jgi:site-specific recombinase XerD